LISNSRFVGAIDENPMYSQFNKAYLKVFTKYYSKLFNSATKGLTKEVQNSSN